MKRNFDIDLEKRDLLLLKEWNCGTLSFVCGYFEFRVDDRTAFKVPLGNVANASYAKNEAIVNFHTNDDAPVFLFEMRFHLPKSGEGGSGDFGDEFMRRVLSHAEVLMAYEDTIFELKEIFLLTPRYCIIRLRLIIHTVLPNHSRRLPMPLSFGFEHSNDRNIVN